MLGIASLELLELVEGCIALVLLRGPAEAYERRNEKAEKERWLVEPWCEGTLVVDHKLEGDSVVINSTPEAQVLWISRRRSSRPLQYIHRIYVPP